MRTYPTWITGIGLTLGVMLAGCNEEPEAAGPTTNPEITAEVAWYVSRGSERDGPFTETQLRSGLGDGSIQPDDLVWRDGMEDWRSADSVLRSVLGLGDADPAATAFLALCTRVAALPDADLNIISMFDAPPGPGTPTATQVRSTMNRHAQLIRDARDVARVVGTIELDHAKGEALLLPHLASARQLARVLRADAALQTEAGNHTLAAADCAAIARISRQVATDGTSLSSLVSIATIEQFVTVFNDLNPAAHSHPDLIDATGWLQQNDPFNFAGALVSERDHILPGRVPAGPARDQCRAAYDRLIQIVEAAPWPDRTETEAFLDDLKGNRYGDAARLITGEVTSQIEWMHRSESKVGRVLRRINAG